MFSRIKSYSNRTLQLIRSYPFWSLFGALGLLVVLIVFANLLRAPAATIEKTTTANKQVSLYRVGSSPKLALQAQIEKSGVVTISALAPGVVQYIGVQPGDEISHGKTLVTLSSTYQGGNAPALQAQLAYQQLQNVEETYNTQKEIIEKQREVAKKTDENNDQLRDISTRSLDETKGSISLNDEIIANLDSQINAGTNVEVNRQLKSQFVSANNQLKSLLRTTEYTSSSDKVPADLSNIQKDITLKTLDIQEKALALQKEIVKLQYQLALVQQQSMMPAAPFRSTVQKVFVRAGQSVNPGTPLVLLSQVAEEDPITATAYVSRDVARRISMTQSSTMTIDTFSIEVYPTYVTSESVKGGLSAVYFSIPDNYASFLTDQSYVDIRIPVGQSDTTASFPYIPLDAVYQNETEAYVYIVNKDRVTSRPVKLGQIFGSYVQIAEGLHDGDGIILDRTVTSGEKITIK